jgi:hypothetical protein
MDRMGVNKLMDRLTKLVMLGLLLAVSAAFGDGGGGFVDEQWRTDTGNSLPLQVEFPSAASEAVVHILEAKGMALSPDMSETVYSPFDAESYINVLNFRACRLRGLPTGFPIEDAGSGTLLFGGEIITENPEVVRELSRAAYGVADLGDVADLVSDVGISYWISDGWEPAPEDQNLISPDAHDQYEETEFRQASLVPSFEIFHVVRAIDNPNVATTVVGQHTLWGTDWYNQVSADLTEYSGAVIDYCFISAAAGVTSPIYALSEFAARVVRDENALWRPQFSAIAFVESTLQVNTLPLEVGWIALGDGAVEVIDDTSSLPTFNAIYGSSGFQNYYDSVIQKWSQPGQPWSFGIVTHATFRGSRGPSGVPPEDDDDDENED